MFFGCWGGGLDRFVPLKGMRGQDNVVGIGHLLANVFPREGLGLCCFGGGGGGGGGREGCDEKGIMDGGT